MTTTIPSTQKMTYSQKRMIKEHIGQNKKRLDFLLGNNGSPHEIFVLRERIAYWTSKLPV